jgi:tetratricopeptide (TPR) repeat protein
MASGMEAILKEAQAAASEAGHPPETADIWTSLGFLELWQGNPAGALEPVRTAIDMLRASGDRIQVADHLSGLGAIMRLLGDTAGAREHFRDVLETYVETKSTVNIPHVLNAFAMLAIDEGKHERAARLLGAAARIREESGGGAPPELMARLGDPYADARKALGEDAFERAHEEGYAMTTEQGVSYGLQDDTEQSMER